MNRLFAAACCAIIAMAGTITHAQERERLGYGRLVTNDAFGDVQDRWRTGSVASSRVWGRGWTGELPGRFGDILELRIGGEIIAPNNTITPAPGDRPYAGALSLGLHTHFRTGALEMAVGADVVVTGSQTGLDGFQDALHSVLGMRGTSGAVRSAQIPNGVHPTLVVEAGHVLSLSDRARLRPFVEGRAGVENILRAGADLTIGEMGQGELLVRDPVTGQRYRAIRQINAGYSFVLGGDIAKVSDSTYLPASRGYSLTNTRDRLRAGVHWQSESGQSAYYGLTWLGREFKAQSSGQLVGSLRLKLVF
ncbi:lipid A-modifier LpxR family protein [Sediminimonas qiaohouensis]|uniref:lipid A-modifier LpxR family protein n=1 Tax=Sediminimonas qiaohouensis TaxID=552061 RepID=UPI00041C0DED|nr:lipid A-modifier LpxR family protein [Sediminimonas qiaohouensis]